MRHSANRIRSIRLVVAGAAAIAILLVGAREARAADTPPVEAAPPPPKAVGGHVGIAVPIVTFAKKTTSVGDQFTIANPIGIGFKVSKKVAVDFETIVATPIHPTGTTGLTVDPGVIFGFDRLSLGLRVKWDINTIANIGLIPLVNYGLVDLGGAMWFIEGAFPVTYAEQQVSLTMVIHTGVGF